ncbi:MAG: acyltransferase [Acidimicrobiia bacterium]
MTSILSRARTEAERTPPDRDRLVDALRVFAMGVVVVGHWLMAVLWIDPSGDVVIANALDDNPTLQLLTWALQVMPLFFLAGGFSNGRSLLAAEADGTIGSWLGRRARRLIVPISLLVAFWAVLAPLMRLWLDDGLVRAAARGALVPLWFIAVYLGIVLLAPLTHRWWLRWGWRTVVVGVALTLLVDLVRFTAGAEWLGWANFAFMWGTVHQAGYGMADWRRPSVGRWLAPIGLGLLILGVTVGPYPLPMIGLDSQTGLNNTEPPTAVILALATMQMGLVGLAAPRLQRALERTRTWTWVVAGGAVVMTWFTWHLTVMILVAALDLAVGGWFLTIEPFSDLWWWTRPVWIAVLTAVTLPLVVALAGLEARGRRGMVERPGWLVAGGVVGAIASVAALVLSGVTWPWVVVFFASVWATGAIPTRHRGSDNVPAT